MKLLTTNNAKTIKGMKKGYNTAILYMSPYTQNSKGINLCSHATEGCASACLFKSGRGGMFTNVQEARIRKSEYYLSDREGFLKQLVEEIGKLVIRNNKKGLITTIRLNGTTDIAYEKFKLESGLTIFETFPDIQFYDYTKNPKRFLKELPANYHLTFSRSENNDVFAKDLLSKGHNVAIVFDKLPLQYWGYDVINGDEDDLRFTDRKGVIVGLKYKRNTEKGANNDIDIFNGFVIAA